MIRVVVWDISGGLNRKTLFEGESIQVTGLSVRTHDGTDILYYHETYETWRDRDENSWYDWTVESIAED